VPEPLDTERVDMHLLLAEDNRVNQKVASLLLRKLGCTVDIANTGREAVDAIEARDYDLVLMDCQMPVMSGVDATIAIRAIERGTKRHTVIVAMTANAMAGDREKFLEAGMDDYLAKPVRGDELLQVLKRWKKARADVRAWGRGNLPDGVLDPEGVLQGVLQMEDGILDREVIESLKSLSESGDPDFFAELVGLFLKDTPERLEAIRQACVEGDAKALEAAAHSLKSSCGNLGAVQLAGLCKDLEVIGRERRIEAAPSLVERSEQEYARVRAALEEEIG
jgi:CheY-like chemotaxis protein/HPt (histidine-containing phosphotransfer) domain-containing protein